MTLADRLIVMNEGRVEQGVASEIKVGIRPHMEAGGSRPVRFEIAVDLVEALGADALVYGRLGDDGISLTVRLPGNTRVAARERLTLSVAIQNIHFFDAGSGRRLG